MKKIFIKLMPCYFVFGVMCCGGTLQDALKESDYTKYKGEETKKIEFFQKKK